MCARVFEEYKQDVTKKNEKMKIDHTSEKIFPPYTVYITSEYTVNSHF